MKSIWHTMNVSLDALNERGANTMAACMGMEFTAIGPDYLRMMMPVNERTRQPYGLLHGGAS
ncbi:MAG TPA: esterase, partial [Chitinophaga sp.]